MVAQVCRAHLLWFDVKLKKSVTDSDLQGFHNLEGLYITCLFIAVLINSLFQAVHNGNADTGFRHRFCNDQINIRIFETM